MKVPRRRGPRGGAESRSRARRDVRASGVRACCGSRAVGKDCQSVHTANMHTRFSERAAHEGFSERHCARGRVRPDPPHPHLHQTAARAAAGIEV
eukprot:scaffold45972_cov59-Phaeocystis_antarctica.AAC.3